MRWFLEGFGGALAGTALQAVDPTGEIGRAVPARHVIGCVVHASCAVNAPGVIRHHFGNGLIIGEPGGGRSARVERLAALPVDQAVAQLLIAARDSDPAVRRRAATIAADLPGDSPRVAAIHYDGSLDVDTALAAFVQQQRAAGRTVLGLLMQHRGGDASCRADMVLTDIDTGEAYLVSQPLGSGSAACAADPQGFARASRVLRDALQRRPDLVVCNRFGSLEAEKMMIARAFDAYDLSKAGHSSAV